MRTGVLLPAFLLAVARDEGEVVVLLQPLLMMGAASHTNIFTAMLGTIIIGIGIDYALGYGSTGVEAH